VCGDGVRVGNEACDDGNTALGDGCTTECTVEPDASCGPAGCPTRCGDGILGPGEMCDFGEANGDGIYGGCTKQCQLGPFCGDGFLQGAEECDLGARNGQQLEVGGCSAACRLYHYCGDGLVDPEVGEACDFGALNGQPEVPCAADCAIILP
jgi:cysteine-rich repeat protein